MASLRTLLERRGAIRDELQSILAAHPEELPEAAQQRWDALRAEADALESRVQRQTLVDDLERRASASPVGSGDASYDRAFNDIGLLDVIRAQAGATDARAGKARELSAEMERRSGRKPQGMFWDMRLGGGIEQRVLTTALPVAGPGGTLIDNVVRSDLFIDRLRRATVVRSLGARVIGGLTANITLPRLSKSVVAAWTPENTEFPVSDPEFNSVALSPRHFGVITELSRNMLQQTSPDAEELVRSDQAKVLAAGLDSASISGSGSGSGSGAGAEPRGIVNTVGVTSTALGATAIFDAVADLVGRVQDSNVDGASRGFLGGASVAMRVRADRWEGNRREVLDAELVECSAVASHAAYPSTVVQARSRRLAAPSGASTALRRRLEAML